jgi:hypothetical protein
LLLRFDDGRICSVPPQWTDAAGPNLEGVVGDGRALCSLADLLALSSLAEIADILNDRGIRPGGSARRAKADAKFTDLRVIYLVKQYGLRSRYDRLRERGMLTKAEAPRGSVKIPRVWSLETPPPDVHRQRR